MPFDFLPPQNPLYTATSLPTPLMPNPVVCICTEVYLGRIREPETYVTKLTKLREERTRSNRRIGMRSHDVHSLGQGLTAMHPGYLVQAHPEDSHREDLTVLPIPKRVREAKRSQHVPHTPRPGSCKTRTPVRSRCEKLLPLLRPCAQLLLT